jgi:hypothetical protein
LEFGVVESFDGGDNGAVGLCGGEEAGVDELAIAEHGAGTAFPFSAPLLGAGEMEIATEDMEERFHGPDVEGVGCAVDG